MKKAEIVPLKLQKLKLLRIKVMRWDSQMKEKCHNYPMKVILEIIRLFLLIFQKLMRIGIQGPNPKRKLRKSQNY